MQFSRINIHLTSLVRDFQSFHDSGSRNEGGKRGSNPGPALWREATGFSTSGPVFFLCRVRGPGDRTNRRWSTRGHHDYSLVCRDPWAHSWTTVRLARQDREPQRVAVKVLATAGGGSGRSTVPPLRGSEGGGLTHPLSAVAELRSSLEAAVNRDGVDPGAVCLARRTGAARWPARVQDSEESGWVRAGPSGLRAEG
jgi:hypothetical protein